MTNIRQKLESELRKSGKANGVKFVQLEAGSAARELGLLEQIEINHPSKEVFEELTVGHPNPENQNNMMSAKVKRSFRVFMDDDEIQEHSAQVAQQNLLDYYAANPDKFSEFKKLFTKKNLSKHKK